MRIVHLASEFAPIAKAGGLGEVLVGLSRELTRRGHEVEILIPKYNLIEPSKLNNLKLELSNFRCLGQDNLAWSAKVEGCSLKLLETKHSELFFERSKIYGYPDDARRFLFFSCLALEYLSLQDKPIDILHLHDWHVSICAPILKEKITPLRVGAICLSIHNLEYQGRCGVKDLEEIGLTKKSFLCSPKFKDPKYPHSINLLKAGISDSDCVIPVSPGYANEILTPEFGFGLDQTLKAHKKKIHGILNGIDTTLWNPENDPLLDFHYAPESLFKAKEHYRKYFQAMQRPCIGAITRLVPQKGPELLIEALKMTLKLGGTFLLLGSSPDPTIQSQFDELKIIYENHPQVFLHYEYNEKLAHRLYAALDFLLVPSKFEPCGLTQLIAMRYGTVPIVRATGGLKDTVFDFENSTVPAKKRNGFCFKDFTIDSMNATIYRAVDLFQKDPSTLKSMVRRGMESDFSWKEPTNKYLRIYRLLSSNKAEVPQKARLI